MVRLRHSQRNLGEVFFAREAESLMEAWMKKADEILEDEQLLDLIYEQLGQRHPQSRKRGRNSTPSEVVLRLMVLKHVRNGSYEVLEREVKVQGSGAGLGCTNDRDRQARPVVAQTTMALRQSLFVSYPGLGLGALDDQDERIRRCRRSRVPASTGDWTPARVNDYGLGVQSTAPGSGAMERVTHGPGSGETKVGAQGRAGDDPHPAAES